MFYFGVDYHYHMIHNPSCLSGCMFAFLPILHGAHHVGALPTPDIHTGAQRLLAHPVALLGDFSRYDPGRFKKIW